MKSAAPHQEKLAFIQILRGIAALLIVVWHSDLALELFQNDYWRDGNSFYRAQVYPFWANNLHIGVDLFFCVSGFIMTMLAARARSSGDALLFLRDRFIRILPPYWFFTFAIVLLYAASPSFHTWRFTGLLGQDITATVYSLLLLPIKLGPVLSIGWTLVHEFFFYYFITLLIALKLGTRVTIALFIAAAIGVVFRLIGFELFNGYFLSDYYVEFFFGSLSYVLYKKTRQFQPLLQLALAIALYFPLSWLIDVYVDTAAAKLLNAFGSGIIAFLLISSLAGLDKKHDFASAPFGRFLVKLGDASYSLYLSHWFTLSFIGKLALPFTDLPVPLIILWHGAAICVTVWVGYVFAHRIELPLHKKIVNIVRPKPRAKA
jgi:peptidoglycan/LPS O-acetylase OafA/YrhL